VLRWRERWPPLPKPIHLISRNDYFVVRVCISLVETRQRFNVALRVLTQCPKEVVVCIQLLGEVLGLCSIVRQRKPKNRCRVYLAHTVNSSKKTQRTHKGTEKERTPMYEVQQADPHIHPPRPTDRLIRAVNACYGHRKGSVT